MINTQNKTLDKKSQMHQCVKDKYTKEQKGATITRLAEELSVSNDFILGMVEANGLYRTRNEIVTLAGLGVDRCIVCAGENMPDYKSMKIQVSQDVFREIQKNRKLDDSISCTIKGHRECFKSIDVFFRTDNDLSCWYCSAWSGEWVDGDEVKEECSMLGDREAGHKGIIGAKKMCNYFGPNYDMRTKKDGHLERSLAFWEKINPELKQRTAEGYKKLVAILEHAQLIG